MLTTLAPTLALHASPLPSSLQTALDPAYPVPLRSSACYEDALLAEERARNSSTQLRCSAPVEAPPDGVRYEKATFPVFIPKCECERVMREIRAYCKAEEPLGDLNLDKFGCMYDEWCTEVLCAVRKADCCPFQGSHMARVECMRIVSNLAHCARDAMLFTCLLIPLLVRSEPIPGVVRAQSNSLRNI